MGVGINGHIHDSANLGIVGDDRKIYTWFRQITTKPKQVFCNTSNLFLTKEPVCLGSRILKLWHPSSLSLAVVLLTLHISKQIITSTCTTKCSKYHDNT